MRSRFRKFTLQRARGQMKVIPLAAVLLAAPTCSFLATTPILLQGPRSWRAGRDVPCMSTTASPIRTKAELKDEFFRGSLERVEFGSEQSVQAPIPGAPLASMQEYLLDDPSRIVYACWENTRIESLGGGVFRLTLKEQTFLSLSLSMSVDVELWADGNTVRCQSVGFSVAEMTALLGTEFAKSFSLEVEGDLTVEEQVTKVRTLSLKKTVLSGNVGVTIGGKMPALMAVTPMPLVKAAALGVNARVLNYVSNTFVGTVANDYRAWALLKQQQQKEEGGGRGVA